ncbi:hypothetical protein B0H12DRAFT_1027852 [Mycena haematopus]|nr:hypothetical protein B0H12DRAFT_1027852 [Mycena haematopus]
MLILRPVITMYSKGGGKAGKHNWISTAHGVGKISYVFTQTFQHSGGRVFRRVHLASALLGVSRFAHLLSGSILVRIMDPINLTTNGAEVSRQTAALLRQLQDEKSGLIRMVTILNTVQRKGAGNVNVMDVEEDDGVDV